MWRVLVLVSICACDVGARIATHRSLLEPWGSYEADRCQAAGVKCMSAAEARYAEEQRIDSDHAIVSQARALTTAAATAARSGDCAQVEKVEDEIDRLPDAHLEQGVHDAIFLRDPDVVRCLAERRHAAKPVAVASRHRPDCIRAREEVFAELFASHDRDLIADLHECDATSDLERANEAAWRASRDAFVAAARGDCAAALASEASIRALDPDHDVLVFRIEPHIAACRPAADARADEHERCVARRKLGQRKAMQVADPAMRGSLLAGLPRC